MTTDIQTTADIERTILDTLRANPDGVTDDLLAASVVGRTDADVDAVRESIGHLERTGRIYSPDAGDTWKVTYL